MCIQIVAREKFYIFFFALDMIKVEIAISVLTEKIDIR